MKYAIYDNYVDKVLCHLNRRDDYFHLIYPDSKTGGFTSQDLKDYKTYMNAIGAFQKFYHLEEYNLKQIDHYLWQLGKEYFKRNY